MDTVQVRINEEGTLRNQRFAFSDRFTLVTELLQNARRAGATLIEVSHDPVSRTLRVRDNGHGIDDFGKLLAFNESGWGEALRAEEHPFGAGFSRCLYAATRCTVISRGRQIAFDTAAALARCEIPVEETDYGPEMGTIIELEGVELPDLDSRLATLCMGFPVQVEFNGRPIDRPRAPYRLNSVETPVGSIHLVGTHSGQHSLSVDVYLQGFRVMFLPNYLSITETPNVVHLDSKVFFARLPDRDTLIDADVQETKIRQQIRQTWRDTLLVRKAQMAAGELIEDFFNVMRHHRHLELLNDIELIPRQVCERIKGYPQRTPTPHLDFLEHPVHALPRQDIESGRFQLVRLDWPDGQNAAKWMLARAKGYVVMASDDLDAGHWIHPTVRDLNKEDVSIRVTHEHQRSYLDGRWISAHVILCEEVTVCMGDVEATFSEDGLYHDGTLYIPAGERSGRAVRQCASYYDGHDRFHESDMNADVGALADLIRRLRMADPEEAMRSLISDARSERYPLLHGLSFRVQIGIDAGSHEISLIE